MVRKAKGNASTRLDVLEQQAEKERQERVKVQERQFNAALKRLSQEDYTFMADFEGRCERDPELRRRTMEAAESISRTDTTPPDMDEWLGVLLHIAPDAVVPSAPAGAAEWFREAADVWHEALNGPAGETAMLQDAARWMRGFFRASANLADVLDAERRV